MPPLLCLHPPVLPGRAQSQCFSVAVTTMVKPLAHALALALLPVALGSTNRDDAADVESSSVSWFRAQAAPPDYPDLPIVDLSEYVYSI